jgi:hypothetical protein
MHMLLVIAFLEKVNYGGNFSPDVFFQYLFYTKKVFLQEFIESVPKFP